MGAPWDSLSSQWQSLARLWLRTELALVKAARSDLSFNDICQSKLPESPFQVLMVFHFLRQELATLIRMHPLNVVP